jgi:hypothetical protein
MFLNEDTRAVLWDVPVLVHYRGLFSSGPFSNMFLSAGAAFRTVTKVKSSTAIPYPDTSTATDLTTAAPSRRSLVGADSTISPKNQLEVGLGFTF